MEAEIRPFKMTEKMVGLVAKYWQDLWENHRAGKFVAWCSGQSPFQVLRAMDIEVVWPEIYGFICSGAGISTELCQQAEAVGYSPDLCSVVRNSIGLTHGPATPEPERLPFGGLPKPDLLLCQPYCPGIYKMWKEYSRFFNVPLLVMEKARLHDSLGKEETAHLVSQGIKEIREIIAFLEWFTGSRFNQDRLSQRMALEWKAARLWLDTLEMCRNIPAPMSIFDAFTHLFPLYLHRGTPEAVTYYQELKGEQAERVANKIGPVTSEEKYRLYWDNLPIFYKAEELTQKFASHGALPVVASLPFIFAFLPDLNLENPLKMIVEILLLNPSNRGLKGRIEFISGLVEGFSVDGLVMQRSRTCLMFNMGQDDITEALTKKTGLPAMVVEGDVCDSRFFSDAEFDSKIDAFMEILTQRGPRRS